MGILSTIERRSPENPNTSLSNPDAWLWDAWGASKTAAGVSVNETSALRVTAVFACVRVLAESIASLPLFVYERLSEGKRRAPDHPVYHLLHTQPNPDMSAMTYREVIIGHTATWGNHYSWIEMDNAARIKALWPLLPDRTYAERVGGKKRYVTQVNGEHIVLPADQVLHVPGLGFDGLTGYSPIMMARQAVGLAMATEEFGARWFSNGSRLSGVLQHPARLSKEAHDRLRASWDSIHQGITNSHKAAILEEGMTWQQIGVPPEDAQFLETRKFQTAEIARVFRVPPHLIGDLERATFSNIEHQSIEFVVHTLRPWLVRLEQAFNISLFGPREANRFFAEHLVDGLLRGDMRSRSEALAIWRQNGIINADEWREMENLNPQPDGQGKQYLVQVNMTPANRLDEVIDAKLAPPPASIAEEGEEEDGEDIARAFTPLIEEAALRCVRREASAVGAKARSMLSQGKHAEFLAWVDDWYAGHRSYVERQFAPVLAAIGKLTGADESRTRPALGHLCDAAWVRTLNADKVDGALQYLEETVPAFTAAAVLDAITKQEA